MKDFGPREPDALLIAWAEAAHRFIDHAAHMQYKPNVAVVRETLRRLQCAAPSAQ